VYFNVDHVCESILKRVHAEPTPPKLVVLDLSAAPRVDLQSAQALAGMADELTAKGIRFQAVEPRSSVRDRLRNEGVDGKLGGVNRFTSVADAVEDFQKTVIASCLVAITVVIHAGGLGMVLAHVLHSPARTDTRFWPITGCLFASRGC
jgi:MFS superfamily sulfate permease-like transporter